MKNIILLFLFAVFISHVYSSFVELPTVVEKTRHHAHYKPRRHHYRKEAFAEPEDKDAIHEIIEPQTKKIIAAVESIDGFNSSTSNNVYETKLTYRPGPDFYADIFKIPISVLQAVSNFLGNNIAYINSTTTPAQGSVPVQSGIKPKPLILSSILPLLPASHPLQSSSTLTPESDMLPALQDTHDTPYSIPEVASGLSSSEIVASPRQ